MRALLLPLLARARARVCTYYVRVRAPRPATPRAHDTRTSPTAPPHTMASAVMSAAAVKPAAAAARVAPKAPKAMQVWPPTMNYETFSFLPPLSDQDIARQVEYCVSSGWTPCIEFDEGPRALLHRSSDFVKTAQPGYQDGRYWMMWKLPMYGCNNPGQVLDEIQQCKRAYPNAYIRMIGFDSVRQVQCLSFIVSKPPGY